MRILTIIFHHITHMPMYITIPLKDIEILQQNRGIYESINYKHAINRKVPCLIIAGHLMT